jgi:DNA-binding FrmR family transcriptional regulator
MEKMIDWIEVQRIQSIKGQLEPMVKWLEPMVCCLDLEDQMLQEVAASVPTLPKVRLHRRMGCWKRFLE